MDMEIKEGEHLAIIGPNASGKTAMVQQFCRKHPLEVEYVEFRDTYGDAADGQYYLQLRWNTAELDNHIELDDWQKKLYYLSSGELRKHRLARALARDRHYLVLDNPYIGLDVESRGVLSDELAKIAQSGRQIILVMPRRDVIPSFITRTVETDSVDIFENQSLEEIEENILNLPEKPLDSFYPSSAGEAPEIVGCHDVSIRYGERTILSHLDWTVKEGEKWAVRGENGSGKSTLLSLVCADNPQSYACHIELFSHKRGSGESIWDIKRHIGYVSPELHRAYCRNVTGLQIVSSGLFDTIGFFRRTTPEQTETCRFWMGIFGIKHLEDRSFLKMSSGEQRLCLLARAFVKDPQLLVLDEPMHGLDEDNSARVRAIVDSFMKRPHKTLLYVTHFDSELPDCIDRRLFLRKQ